MNIDLPTELVPSRLHDIQRSVPVCVALREYFHEEQPKFVSLIKQLVYPERPGCAAPAQTVKIPA